MSHRDLPIGIEEITGLYVAPITYLYHIARWGTIQIYGNGIIKITEWS